MSYRYFGQCVAGLEPVAAEILRRRLPDLEGLELSGGAVAFSTTVPYSDLNLFCFNNLFRVLYAAEEAPDKSGLERFLRRLPQAPADWQASRAHPKKFRTFRLMVSCKNQLVSVPKNVKAAVEQKIQSESGLIPDRSLPDSEFWAMVRADGKAYFLQRLSRHRAYDKVLAPGELHPELAYMLCFLSDPHPDDVAADPFCGHGALPLQRCKRFPYAKVYAFDSNETMVKLTREKLPKKDSIVVERRDALALAEALPPASLDAIITDPPWGLYQEMDGDLTEFYRLALVQMEAVLKPSGRLVLLTAAKREFEAALEATVGLALTARYDVLVSGKKAAVFIANKRVER